MHSGPSDTTKTQRCAEDLILADDPPDQVVAKPTLGEEAHLAQAFLRITRYAAKAPLPQSPGARLLALLEAA